MAVSESKSQLDKFKQAARDLETDDDPERFRERLRQVVKPGAARNKDRTDSTE